MVAQAKPETSEEFPVYESQEVPFRLHGIGVGIVLTVCVCACVRVCVLFPVSGAAVKALLERGVV